MGKRGRKRTRTGGESPKGPPPATTSYPDADGNVIVLRDGLSEGVLRGLEKLDSRPASNTEDRWQRRMEYLFERLAVRWEISGLPLEGQHELLARYRMASSEERRQVRDTLVEHLRSRHPEIEV